MENILCTLSPTLSVGISPTLRPRPVAHPLQHLRQLSSNTARLLWQDALASDLPADSNTVDMPTAGPFYLEDIVLPSSIQSPRGCKRPRSFTTSCLEEELGKALDEAQPSSSPLQGFQDLHIDSYPVNNLDPMATMAFPPGDVHMQSMLEGSTSSRGAGITPNPSTNSSTPSSPSQPSPPSPPVVRYRPMRKMCRRPSKRYRGRNAS